MRNQVGPLLKAVGKFDFIGVKAVLVKDITRASLIQDDENKGWKTMETSLRTLLHCVQSVGNEVYGGDMKDLYTTISDSVRHANRFVREVSFNLCESLIAVVREAQAVEVCEAVVPCLVVGLCDSWPQVRFTAS